MPQRTVKVESLADRFLAQARRQLLLFEGRLREGDLALPCSESGSLDVSIGFLPGEAFVDQGEEQGLAEDLATGELALTRPGVWPSA